MRKVIFGFLLLLPGWALAQEDLLQVLEEREEPTIEYTTGTFKSTRLIGTYTVDIQPKGELLFTISHRFGPLSENGRSLFGLDNAQIRLGLEYGITDWWAVGLGRSQQDALIDSYSKIKLLRQSSGKRFMPVTVVWNATLSTQTSNGELPNGDGISFSDRLFYSHQLLIARKFGKRLSLQIAPTFFHRNLRQFDQEQHDEGAFGVGGRYKITNRLAITGEYYYLLNRDYLELFNEPLSIGVEIETGGHIFQLVMSNSVGMTEKTYITQTLGDWAEGDFFFGFNISRTFDINRTRHKKRRKHVADPEE